MILEHKDYNEVVLKVSPQGICLVLPECFRPSPKVGLGWEHQLTDDKIRSSVNITDDIYIPKDYKKLEERNILDVKVRRK